MKKTSMLSSVSLLVTMAGLSLSGASFASAPASIGYAVQHSDANCFNVSNGQEENTCSGTKRWEVSDFVAPGNHLVQVTGLRPNGGQFLCFACGATKEGSLTGCTPAVSPSVVDVHTQFTVGTVMVPTFGTLWVACDMTQFAFYDSVNF